MNRKETRISVRIDAETKARLQKAVADTGISEPELVKNCILALLKYIEENGEITFPLRVLPLSVPKARGSTSYPSRSEEYAIAAEMHDRPKTKKKKAA